MLGWDPKAISKQLKLNPGSSKSAGWATVEFFESEKAYTQKVKTIAKNYPKWQQANLAKPIVEFTGEQGPHIVVCAQPQKTGDHGGLLDGSPFGAARDVCANLFSILARYGVTGVHVDTTQLSNEGKRGSVVGMALCLYRFLEAYEPKKYPPNQFQLHWQDKNFSKKDFNQAVAIGVSTNLARHLVNLPAEDLNPLSYCKIAKALFSNSSTMSVEVWTEQRLKKENMGLLLGVGRAAKYPPRLLILRHRPKAKTAVPLAFVGKGVTFDSGGLDIKPAAGMRLMKKDMGGSASVMGIAHFVEQAKIPQACDFYLALAENAIGGDAMRPGDVLQSRAGISVEIGNTDAEGRLVMADAIDVAVTQKRAPLALIDISTLTGAMRVSLGLDVGGMLSNHDPLADKLLNAGQRAGDNCWRMPLVQSYAETLVSNFADINNTASSSFGGAITAALFLRRFVRNVPWAHFDVMAWNVRPTGAIREVGGNGQVVQALALFLEECDNLTKELGLKK